MKVFNRALLVLVGAAVATQGLAAQESAVRVGDAAPAIAVPDLDGHPVDLGQYIGKRPILLEFWATWCPVCQELLPRMRAAHQKYGNQVVFLGIDVAVDQTPDQVRRYIEQHQFPFQVLYDAEGVSVRAYDALQTSYIVIIDKSGRVVYTGVGSEQQFEPALQKVTGG